MSARIRIEEVLTLLGVDADELLSQLRAEGLFEPEELEPEEAEELRVATTLIQELGVNAAGVEVILHLRRQLLRLQGHMTEVLAIVREEDESS